MRISLGCSQVRLMRQFLTESALLAVLGGAASLAVAYCTANLLGRFLAGRGNLPICGRPGLRVSWRWPRRSQPWRCVVFGLFPGVAGLAPANAAWLKQGAGSVGPAAA